MNQTTTAGLDLDKLEALAHAAETDITACARFTTTFDPAGVLALIDLARRAEPSVAADERAGFEAWMKARPGYPFAGVFADLMWAAWQARAALASPAVSQKDNARNQYEKEHARTNHQGAAQDEGHDASAAGFGGGAGADQHHEHREGQSGADGRDGLKDGGSAGVSNRGEVREVVKFASATEGWQDQFDARFSATEAAPAVSQKDGAASAGYSKEWSERMLEKELSFGGNIEAGATTASASEQKDGAA